MLLFGNIEGEEHGMVDFNEYVMGIEWLQQNVDSLIDNS